ncbi:MAG: class I SAM-dependent methyltransferase [Chloroflexaceae bacterium]|nr:class I SAM-dependent methyltransferase [Chloroflexaceae bacterium]
MDVLYAIYDGIPRQGPGSNAATRQAWSLLPDVPPSPGILDIGCGSGIQTLELARLSGGRIIALDNHQPYLDALQQRAASEQLAAHIETLNCSMDAMEFAPGSFDIIWSEGAIYIIGFERGLSVCQPLLKPGGFLVVSHITWLTADRSPELAQFWHDEGVTICTAAENVQRIEQAGYHCLAHFPLPQAAWWDEFYHLIEQKLPALRQTYRDDPERLAVVHNQQHEIDLYRMYADQYGYVFYVMRFIGDG